MQFLNKHFTNVFILDQKYLYGSIRTYIEKSKPM